MLGAGETADELIRVERYQDGIALLSSGPVSVDAERLFLLSYTLSFDEDIVSLDQAPAFFWRRADQLREVSRVTLDSSGFADLSQSEDWRGDIVELGFFFVENRGEPAEIGSVTLEGEGLASTYGKFRGNGSPMPAGRRRPVTGFRAAPLSRCCVLRLSFCWPLFSGLFSAGCWQAKPLLCL